MTRANTSTSYGSTAKSFHWLTALLIFSVLPLGLVANNMAEAIKDPTIATTDADIARTAMLFSIHKTIGVAIFFVALARIAWAIGQPKPHLLNGDKRLEAWAATTVHWLLYSALFIVPLSGWIHHAATTGFAPIWWPFGQSLPFVPKDPSLAEWTTKLHHLGICVLVGSLVLHISGALKHHVVDGDATLRRILPGRVEAQTPAAQPGETLPVLTAVLAWIAVLIMGGALSIISPDAAEQNAALETVDSQWQVTDGALEIAVLQLGSVVNGGFTDWTAAIDYAETPDDEGHHGAVRVTINIASLTLGSVTDQAKGADYFDLETFPTATFEANILSTETGKIAKGALTIKDQSVPVEMPFELTIEGEQANASGSLSVDRRDFLIGVGTLDEGSLGFGVDIAFQLNAIRGS